MFRRTPSPEQPSQDVPPDGEGPPPFREWMRGWLLSRLRDAQFTVYTVLVLSLVALSFLWPRMFISVPSGNCAVMYRFFRGGTVTDRVWGEGLNVIPPWNKLILYETRIQQKQLDFEVLSEEGLKLGVELSVRYRPVKEMLGYLHRDIGNDYFERLIQPEIKSHVRRTFGRRPAHEISSSAGDLLQELSRMAMLSRVEEHDGTAHPYIQIMETKILDIKLPAIVASAIADKYRQEQLMLEYRYKLEREEKEAERKRTEAAGIRDYNLIASKVTPDLLRWRNIEAALEVAKTTLELAKSPNTKVVVLGGGPSSQLLLNVDSSFGMHGAPAGSASAAKDAEPVQVPPPGMDPIPAPTPDAGTASALSDAGMSSDNADAGAPGTDAGAASAP